MFGRRRKRGWWARRRNRWLLPLLGVSAATAALGVMKLKQSDRGRHSPTSSDRLTTTTRTIVVNRQPDEVYRFWADVEQFPRFMRHLKQVSVTKDGTSHWKAYGPGGQVYAWDARTVESRPDELISWRSLPGGDVENEGSVRFERAPGGRGTLVRVNLRYAPPAGKAGSAIAMLLGREPGQEVQQDLRRFKQVLETGEVVHSDASIHHRSHPARPDAAAFHLPTPVPGAGPAEPAHGQAAATHDAGPETGDRPSRRHDADEPAATARGGRR